MESIREASKVPSTLMKAVIKSIGFGFYLVWQRMLVNTPLLNVQFDGSILGIPIDRIYNLYNTLLIVILFVFIGIILPVKYLPLNAHKSLYVVAALFAGFGTIITTQDANTLPLLVVCPVFKGLGEVLIILMWGEYCRSIGLHRIGLFLLFSHLFAAGIFIITVYTPNTISLLLTTLYPILSVLLLLWDRKRSVRNNMVVVKSTEHQVFTVIKSVGLLKVFLSLGVLYFSVYLAFFSIDSIELIVLYDHNILMAINAATVITAILTLSGVALLKRKSRLDIIVNIIIVVLAIGHILIPFIGPSQGLLVSVILKCGNTGFFLVSWIVFSGITHSLNVPPAKVFAWGRALSIGGIGLGSFAGSLIVLIPAENETSLIIITLLNMFLLILSAAFLSSGYMIVRNLEASTQELDFTAQVLESIVKKHGLTSREKEVAAFLIRGRSLPYLEKELGISHGTANAHMQKIYRKLDIHSRQELLDAFQSVEKEFFDRQGQTLHHS